MDAGVAGSCRRAREIRAEAISGNRQPAGHHRTTAAPSAGLVWPGSVTAYPVTWPGSVSLNRTRTSTPASRSRAKNPGSPPSLLSRNGHLVPEHRAHGSSGQLRCGKGLMPGWLLPARP